MANLRYKVSKAVLRRQKKRKKKTAASPGLLSHGTALLHVGLCMVQQPQQATAMGRLGWEHPPVTRAPKTGANPSVWGALGSVGAQGYVGLAQGHSEVSPGGTSGSCLP